MNWNRHLILCSMTILLLSGKVPGADPGVEFFETKIRPVLVEHCYACHSSSSKKLEGGLSLESREGILKGGDSGAALKPGDPKGSLILQALRYDDPTLQMPPDRQLSAEIQRNFETWIQQGAPDPRAKVERKKVSTWDETLAARRDWWSLQPVATGPLPPIKSLRLPEDPIDRYLTARLEKEGLTGAAPASPRVLIRRLSLVLTGLLPTPAEVSEFVAECESSPQRQSAVERLVDRLLASPHFGERWARHWLDLVRFSETHGNEWNYEVHHAWRYRDYLIRAFNADVPYDQFIREHFAGDLLPHPRLNPEQTINESVIGTAFFRFGEVNHDDCITLKSLGYDIIDNQIDTLSKAFQATTVSCARCHDHKMDAVSMKDYYGLLGILRSSRIVSHTIDTPRVNADLIERMRTLKGSLRQEIGNVWQRDVEALAELLTSTSNRPSAAATDPQIAKRQERLAALLKTDKLSEDHPLSAWWTLSRRPASSEFSGLWKQTRDRILKLTDERQKLVSKNFETFADFRNGIPEDWQVGGQGLRDTRISSGGDFAPALEGDTLLRSLLPSGCFTHSVSDKLNGTLRSQVLQSKKKYLSFRVLGERSSALRLVSNNCQLNYANYKALVYPEFRWLTFTPPADRTELRTYAELMCMFDNPKFPDQLSALGGDKGNYKLPWEKASENPRSYWGVTHAVWHDTPEPPPVELTHLQPLWETVSIASGAELAGKYRELLSAVVARFQQGIATDHDVTWLQAFLREGLLSNSTSMSPRIQELARDYRVCDQQLSLPQVTPGIADWGAGFDQPILARGDCQRPGAPTPRRYLEVISGASPIAAEQGSGRLELAYQIASPTNPLTARVMVNRLWHHLFGQGIVRSVDDFGHVGELPTHPELLDHLAERFIRQGWSIKRMIRDIVLTEAFQRDHIPSPAASERDPQNRWLQHYSARRLEAEGIRDAILTASGRLDPKLYGLSIYPYREHENADRRLFPGPLDGQGRRSLYIKNTLMEGPKFLNAFNSPGGKVAQGRRESTNVPSQALALLNDPFVLQQADVWGKKLSQSLSLTEEQKLATMFETALGRPPRPTEQQDFKQLIAELASLHGIPKHQIDSSSAIWKDVAHTMFNLQEFLFVP